MHSVFIESEVKKMAYQKPEVKVYVRECETCEAKDCTCAC